MALFATFLQRTRILLWVPHSLLSRSNDSVGRLQRRAFHPRPVVDKVTLVQVFVHGSVHRESMSIIVQQDATIYSLLDFCKLLYMFRAVTPPIIRSTYNCNYNIWHWSNRLCYLPLYRSCWNCSSNSCSIAAGSRDGLTSARCCNYSYMCS